MIAVTFWLDLYGLSPESYVGVPLKVNGITIGHVTRFVSQKKDRALFEGKVADEYVADGRSTVHDGSENLRATN